MQPAKSLLRRLQFWNRAGDAREAHSVTPPVFAPLAPEYVQNPYPFYETLRQHDPVHRSSTGLWVLTRYRDVLEALENPQLGNAPAPYGVLNERNRERYVCADVANNILPFMDAPEHTARRKLIGRTFNGNLRRQPPDFVSTAESLLDAHRDRGELELLRDFGLPFGVRLISELLGIPASDHDKLKACSEWFFYLFAPIPTEEIRVKVDGALEEFRTYFAQLIEIRRASPGVDLVSELLRAEHRGMTLSDAELIDTCMLLFADGVENIDAGIGSAVASLLHHPDQLKLLQDQPKLMSGAVDELLRYETPAQFIGRVALADLEIDGCLIRKNEGVLLMLGAANRDPEQFAQPDQLNIQRHPNPHVVFGKGQHTCIGASFVGMQFGAALSTIITRLPNLQLATPSQRYTPRLGHRWLAELPVTFTPY